MALASLLIRLQQRLEKSLQWLQQYQGLGIALITGVFLLASVGVFTSSLLEEKRLERSQLRVTGLAEERVNSDKALWVLELSHLQPSTKGLSEQLNHDKKAVLNFLTVAGIPKADVHEESQSLVPQYRMLPSGSTTNEVTGYELRQRIRIETDAVETIATLAADLGFLYEQGISVTPESPQYFYTQLESLKPTLIRNAMKNAKQRAFALSDAAGSHVGALTDASSGVFQITAANSTDVSDYGTYDTATVAKKVTAVVNVQFALR